jgi:hypothetical protein
MNMKLRTVIPHDSTPMLHIEIMPAGLEWDMGHGYLSIWFFELDTEVGKYFYLPQIKPNVSLGTMSPDRAGAWGECMMLANQVANVSEHIDRIDNINDKQCAEIWRAWQRVNEYRATLEGKMAA